MCMKRTKNHGIRKSPINNFVDIDDIISPSGRRNMAMLPEPKPEPVAPNISSKFALPHVISRDSDPTWEDTIKIGDNLWSMADLDFIDCEDIDCPGTGIRYYCGAVYYTFKAAQRIVNKLDGWHIPGPQEWFDAAKNSYFDRKEFREGLPNAESNLCWADHVRMLTAKLAMLPVGMWYADNGANEKWRNVVGFGDSVTYFLSNGGTVRFSSSLSIMEVCLEKRVATREYMPIRLVRDRT